ncbi:MAG: Asp23/Gls24 family envelope stress response protein [Intrasporangium sp.]|uniref:Asp23/Gls24 family envelope stress response protein n=1 Tax=Intrasporangium sp. TaxID=1925024 RepID=UPI003F81B4B1
MSSTPASTSSTSTETAGSSGTTTRSGGGSSQLQTSQGNTTIADGVVQKIAGLAAREVSGVYELGGSAARALGAIRERIPGSSQTSGQGVSVEVGERQAAVDLEMVAEYGVSITELARAVRRNVISAVEGMTGLEVTEVNIAVNDIHLPTADGADQPPAPERVQ